MTSTPEVPVAASSQVTLLDVYTRQIQMQGKLDRIDDHLQAISDHENRIRRLEEARARVYGVAAVLGVLAGGGAGWAALLASRR